METTVKKEIKECLQVYVARYPSQNKAVDSFGKLVSGSYISQILNDKWDAISDEMWRRIGQHIGWVNTSWVFTETSISCKIIEAFDLARKNEVVNITSILTRGGSGKSKTLEYYRKNYREVLSVECKTLNPKSFLSALLNSAGQKSEGMNTEDLFECLVDVVLKMNNPIIVIDEINKASDKILLKLIDLYNALKYKCPIVVMSTQEFKQRIDNGIAKKSPKTGYDEFYSRCSRKFFDFGRPDYNDVAKVCIANGVYDQEAISRIAKDSDCDLRSVEQHIRIYFLKQLKAA